MQSRFSTLFGRLAFSALLVCLSLVAKAQSTGVLYDPQPPVDSAYVRVILASQEGAVDVFVDGQPRLRKLGAYEASDYMVLTAGQHSIALHPAGKSKAYLATTLDVVKGRAMSVAFTALRPDTKPILFEDKANSNKLKAGLAVYHLAGKVAPLDILTKDGATQVFLNVGYGTSSYMLVNPVAIELIATKVGDKVPLANASLRMAQGGGYSIFLLPDPAGKLIAKSVQNKIEVYIKR